MRVPPENVIGPILRRWLRRKCEACQGPISDKYNVYGSGRFCSDNCRRLRTPEKFFEWEMEVSASLPPPPAEPATSGSQYDFVRAWY